MNKMIVILIFLLTVKSNATWLAPEDIRRDLQPVHESDSNISETEFQSIIRDIQNIYSPIVSSKGGKLSINGDWKSETPNAGAMQMFGNWQVKITGGLARRPELSRDGFALILCHELGHHLGGFSIAPAGHPMEKPWAANEGQSDYFATQSCARKVWGGQFAVNAEFRKTVSQKSKELCDLVWTTVSEQDLCYRVLTAVESMTTTMAVLTKKPIPDFETPDQSIVEKTSHRHPVAQCRMDTSLQGALCTAQFNEAIIPGKNTPGGVEGIEAEREAATFSCTNYSGYNIGLRSTCWFKPRL